MNSVHIFVRIFILSFLIIPTTTWGKKPERVLKKTESLYERGEYRKAFKKLNQYNKTEMSEVIAPLQGRIFIYQAKYLNALGHLKKFNETIEKGIQISLAMFGEDSSAYAYDLINAAETYYIYGNYRQAQRLLNKSKEILESKGLYADNINAQPHLLQIQNWLALGYTSQAITKCLKSTKYFQSRTFDKKVSYIHPKSGKEKQRKLSRAEKDVRLEDYGMIKSLLGASYLQQGDTYRADSTINKTDAFLKVMIGKDSKAYLHHLYHSALLFYNSNDYESAKKAVELGMKLTNKKDNPYHLSYLSFQEKLLNIYLKKHDKIKFKKELKEYDDVTRGYFKKKSIHFLNNEILASKEKITFEKAKRLDRKILDILKDKRLPKYHTRRIEALNLLYQYQISQRMFVDAKESLQKKQDQVLELYGEDSYSFKQSSIDMANYLILYSNNLDSAMQIYEANFFGVLEDEYRYGNQHLIESLNALAILYSNLDQFEKASSVLNNAITYTKQKYRGRKNISLAIELAHISALQLEIGEIKSAQKNILQSIQLFKRFIEKANSADIAYALETKARILNTLGLFDEAKKALYKSQKLYKKDKLNQEADLNSIEGLASIYTNLGKYDITNKLLRELINDNKRIFGEESIKLIKPLTLSGKLNVITGNFAEAEANAKQAQQIILKYYGKQSSKLAPTLLLMADIQLAIGDTEKALSLSKQAKDILIQQLGSQHITVAEATTQLALIQYYNHTPLKKVISELETAQSIITDNLGSNNPYYAKVLHTLSIVNISAGQYDISLKLLEKEAEIWAEILSKKNNIHFANIDLLRGDINYRKKNYEQAKKHYKSAQNSFAKIFSEKHPEYLNVVSKLGRTSYMLNDKKGAQKLIQETTSSYKTFITEYFPYLSEREKGKYWTKIKEDFEFYNTIAYELQNKYPEISEEVYNNALITKSLLLNSTIKTKSRILNSGDSLLIDKYNDWQLKKEQLTNMLSLSKDELAENEIDINKLESNIESLEKDINQEANYFHISKKKKTITWESIAAKLKPNEIAIEIIRYRKFNHQFTDSIFYIALLINDTIKQPQLIKLNEGEDAYEKKRLSFYRNSVRFGIQDKESYQFLWKPIDAYTATAKNIYLSPDGIYNQINLETLIDNNGNYLIDQVNIILVNNTKDIYQYKSKEKKPNKSPSILFGNPQYYHLASNNTKQHRIKSLPGTAIEVKEVNKLVNQEGWETKIYTGQSAKEELIKEINSPKIFHIATHGFFTEKKSSQTEKEYEILIDRIFHNPMLRCGLMLSGAGDILDSTNYNYNIKEGILTAQEAMSLNLDNTELVVLSACETGVGDIQAGEGVYGLQRAFLVAGAESVIMSLFQVSDLASQRLMIIFYDEWLKSGNKREAFIKAKQAIREEFEDPIYWGAFVMIGMN